MSTSAPPLVSVAAALHTARVDSPVGPLWVQCDGVVITGLSFRPSGAPVTTVPAVLDEARRQLDAYFARRLQRFQLPLSRSGTRSQLLVREALEQVSYGTATTYQAMADRLGGTVVARAVGNACARNPLPIIVPCHRVLSSRGELTGYIGGLAAKQWLLEHEGVLAKALFEVG